MKPARIELTVPIDARQIESVTVDGQQTDAKLTPGLGHCVAQISIASSSKPIAVELKLTHRQVLNSPITVTGDVGTEATLSCAGPVVDWVDPQGVLDQPQVSEHSIQAKFATAGDAMVLAKVGSGDNVYWQEFKIRTTDSATEKVQADQVLTTAPPDARWQSVDLAKSFNGDVRTIFQQKYLSPRPNTCSLRLAIDGYSTWQMILDPKNAIPKITLDVAEKGVGSENVFTVPAGVRFAWPSGEKNIAFTSQWDNWPRKVTIPINATGEAAWFLVCGSTNPMQVRIANARIVLQYADDVEETIELVPPFNFWSLCKMGKADYDLSRDGFAIGKVPSLVQLGDNCRANLIGHRLRAGVRLRSATLECMSQEVVIGVMGASIMNSREP
jgi:hypothetical protein